MSESKRIETQSLCLESMSKLKIGTGPEEKQNGKDFKNSKDKPILALLHFMSPIEIYVVVLFCQP